MRVQSLLLRLLPLPPSGRIFADMEWRALVRLAEALIPDTGALPSEDIADNVERFLLRRRSRRARRVRMLMQVVEWSPRTVGHKPFSQMSLRERRRLVEERYIDGSGIWRICAKARYLVLMGVYGDGGVHGPTDYVPVSRRRRFAQAPTFAGGVVAS